MEEPSYKDFEHDEPIELRVLHGPQAGSTLPIEPGQEYTLGTADTCAVLLAGTQIEAEHVTLYADGAGIHVIPREGKVLTLERTEIAMDEVLELGAVMRLGRVLLTVDKVDAPWPHDETLEEPAAAAPTAQPEEAQETHLPESEPAAPVKPATHAARSRTFLPTLLAGTVAMLLMGAAVAAWVSGTVPPPAAEAVEPNRSAIAAAAPVVPVLDIAELSRNFPEATLRAKRNADGKWVLNGRIATEDARRRLRAAVAPLPGPVEVRVMLDAERMAALVGFVDRRRVAGEVELNVRPGNAGALRIVGAVVTQPGLVAVTEAAHQELADAEPLEFAILLRSELAARFEERLRAAGLASRFKATRGEQQLELQAVLANADVRTWENVFMEFTRDYGSVLTITAKVQHERDAIEGQIEAIVAGPFPYLVTTGGKRIAPGGVIDGRTLVSVRDGELLFSDGLRMRYAN